MDKILLNILVVLLRGLLRRRDVDLQSLYAIVETKLMMDKRRVHMQWKTGQQHENRNHLIWVQLLYMFFGLITAAVTYAIPSFVVIMVIIHLYVIFMMSMTLVSDFSTVLLDTTDNQVILPRPVNGQTLFMARLLHILVYLLKFTAALVLGPVVVMSIKYGLFVGMGLCCTALLSVLLAVFLTYLMYLLILRFSSEQKLKDIITYFQIAITILFTVGYQVMPRMGGLTNFNLELRWYTLILPPVWMALALEPLHTGQMDALHALMAVLAIGVPVGLFWILNRYLAPSFARKLGAMATEAMPAAPLAARAEKRKLSYAARLFCRNTEEKAAFEAVWTITGRDKGFRLQFYPSLGYIPVFIYIFVFRQGQGMHEAWASLPTTRSYLWFIYIPVFTIANALVFVCFTENYAASWIYHSLPVERPGALITGAFKALFVKYFLPLYVLLLAFCLYVWGPAVIDDFLFGICNNVFCFLLITLLSDHYLPFSRQTNARAQTGRFLRVMLQMIMISILVGVHYLLARFASPLVMYALIPFSIAGSYALLRSLQRLSWNKIAV